jgi:hypothetical protein
LPVNGHRRVVRRDGLVAEYPRDMPEYLSRPFLQYGFAG